MLGIFHYVREKVCIFSGIFSATKQEKEETKKGNKDQKKKLTGSSVTGDAV